MMIDVLVPAYNAEDTIEESLWSILKQSYETLRVFVIDDGSFDSTASRVEAICQMDRRVILVSTPNRGIVDALNYGLSFCTADIIARLDADDVAYPNRLSIQFDYLMANPDCVAVGGNVWKIDVNGRRIDRTYYSGDAVGDFMAIPSGEPYLLHPFLMVRRQALKQIGGYRHVYNAEDTDLYWRLSRVGRLHNISDIIGEYRVHSNSLTSGSIVNARIGAVTSQLAAISAKRLSDKRPDIVFQVENTSLYRQATELTSIIKMASLELDSEETVYLHISSAVKLLELRNYRKFRLSYLDLRSCFNIIKAFWRIMSREDKYRLNKVIFSLIRPKFGIKAWLMRTLR